LISNSSLKTNNLAVCCEGFGLNQLRDPLIAQHLLQLADRGIEVSV